MPINFPILFTEGKHQVLVLDPSASHLAYTIITLDFKSKELTVESAGMVWISDKFSRGRRYRYMQQAIKTLVVGCLDQTPKFLITEGFFVNPRMMFGNSVIPTINSLAEMACDELEIPYLEIGPSAWRGILGIKPTKDSKGKRDYKVPTANLVKQYITLPETIPSNINRKMRKLPNDVTDVLAIALSIGRYHGIIKVGQANTAFFPLQWIDKLEKLNKEL